MTSPETGRVTWEGLLALDLPPRWEWTEEDGILTVYDPDGVGALLFSFGQPSAAEPVLDLEALGRQVARSQGLSDRAVVITSVGGHQATYFDGTSAEDDTFWRIWHVAQGQRIARITYSCDAGDRTIEAEPIDGILASVVWPR
jgi:hypothetical protein